MPKYEQQTVFSGTNTKWYVHFNRESGEYHIGTWVEIPRGGTEIDSFWARGKKEALAKGDCIVEDHIAKMMNLARKEDEEES